MKQKFDDLVLLLKRDRKYQIIMLIAVVGLAWAILHKPSAPRVARKLGGPPPLSTGTSGAEESFKDLMQAFKGDVDTLKTDLRETRIEQERMKKETKENNERVSEIFKRVLERLAENETTKASTRTSSPDVGVEDTEDPSNPDQIASLNTSESQGIQEFQPPAPTNVAPPPPPQPNRTAVVGAGDHVRVKLIGAVHAATDGTPYPVLFKVIGDVQGPNNSNLPLGEGLLIAAAQGSLTDQRALFRLSSLNIAFPDGRRSVIEVDGWVVGEDGISGMEGVLIDPLSKVIAATGMAGALQGLGDAFAAKNTTATTNLFGGSQITVTGSEGEYAAGKGLSEATKTYGRLIEDRVKKIPPVVEVLSGREATAIFAKSFKIPGLIEAYQADEDNYSSVD
jgi:hypothetical protein